MELHELKDYLDEKFAMNNEVLNEKFTNVNEKFANVNQKLSAIEIQTTKTNGRVNRLEDKVKDFDKESLNHSINCFVKKDLEDYKEKREAAEILEKKALEEYKTKMGEDLFLFTAMRKYPKFSASIIALIILILVSGNIENVKNLLGF